MLPRPLLLRTLRQATHPTTPRTLKTLICPRIPHPRLTRPASHAPPPLVRWLSSQTPADAKIEELTELYATARDEFEIAAEETEKVSVYAQDDRDAARAELAKVQEAYEGVVGGTDRALAEEVRRRIGQRVRELEQAVAAMEEMARNQD